MREFLGEAAASLRDRAEVEREPQHLRLGHRGPNLLIAVVGLRAHDLAAASVEVGHDVAEILLRDSDLRLHDRLQEHRSGVQRALADSDGPCDLEGHVIGVNLVVLPIH